ncbi:MAG: MFS transporter [Lachnospirales bacterium]
MEKIKNKSKKWVSFFALMLGAGTIYKLYFMDSAFYVQMQEYFKLSHTEIGVIHSVAGWVSTFGFLAAIYITDRFSKRKMIPFAMIGNGIAGLWLSTFPPFPVILIIFSLFAVFSDMLFWPTMLKSIRLLGNKDEQGRMFGFLETGRGLIDTIVNFLALGIFILLGSNAFGFKGAIIFFSLLTIFIGIWSYFVIEDDEDEALETKDKNKQAFDGMKEALSNKDIWLVAINIFTVYAVYCGIKYFVPFLKDIYGMPVALVSTYGIINSYCLKMVGGPIGGFVSDKVTHSAAKFIRAVFVLTTISLFVFVLLPHENLSIAVGMGFAFLISTFTFCMRSVFFAPMDEVKVPRKITGAAMSLGSFIGYLPGAFMGIIYGVQLDSNPGMAGYKLVFITMGIIAIIGIIISTILISVINKK